MAARSRGSTAGAAPPRGSLRMGQGFRGLVLVASAGHFSDGPSSRALLEGSASKNDRPPPRGD
eukprot:9740914-Alexandrium_andersonii.AAC.1